MTVYTVCFSVAQLILSWSQVASAVQSDPGDLWERRSRKSVISSRFNTYMEPPSNTSQNCELSKALDAKNKQTKKQELLGKDMGACRQFFSFAQACFPLPFLLDLCKKSIIRYLINLRFLSQYRCMYRFRCLWPCSICALLPFKANSLLQIDQRIQNLWVEGNEEGIVHLNHPPSAGFLPTIPPMSIH